MTDEVIQEFANKMIRDSQEVKILADMIVALEVRLEAIEKVME